MVSLFEILMTLNRIVPGEAGFQRDYHALQLGTTDAARQQQMTIKRIAVAVAPSSAIVAKACQQKAQILITHLPLIREPLSRISEGVMNQIRFALRDNLVIYTVGYNWIIAENGVTDAIVNLLGLQLSDLYHEIINENRVTVGRICNPKRSMNLENFVRVIAEKFEQKYIEYEGSPTQEINNILLLPYDTPPIKWFNNIQEKGIDTILCGAVTLEHQVLAHDLHANLISIPRYAMAKIGMRRLMQLLQLEHPSIDFSLLDESYTQPIFFL